MLRCIPSHAPHAVRHNVAKLVHDKLVDADEVASARLQHSVFVRLCSNLRALGSAQASNLTDDPTAVRNALIMASAPMPDEQASTREYAAWTGVSRRSCARHVDQRDAPQEKNDNSNVYKLLRKSTVNDMLLQLEENARAFLEREADPRNLGSQGQCKDMVKPKGSRGDHSGYVQKVWLKEAMPKVHQKWIDQLPLHMKEHAVSLTKFREWLPFNMYLARMRHRIGCVCVHHATWAMLEQAYGIIRKPCHRSKKERVGTIQCAVGITCNCTCDACTRQGTLLESAVCTYKGLPRLACVLQHCDDCGMKPLLTCDSKERPKMKHCHSKVRRYMPIEKQFAGHKVIKTVEPVTRDCTLSDVVEELANNAEFMLMHDYLARRLAHMFHHHIDNLGREEEVWVMDYIENFTCFEEYALQQDHYSHNQVTIFVVLCFRHRRPNEEVKKVTYSLPAHLTCELHAFISDDQNHDAGFAQLCLHMILQTKRERGELPLRLKWWSDGGPAHFKLLQQLLFIATVATTYNVVVWWCFFQSCHGER